MATARTCTCCGSYMKPPRPQWWNQDKGYGLCDSCANEIFKSGFHTPESFQECYGKDGVHYKLEKTK